MQDELSQQHIYGPQGALLALKDTCIEKNIDVSVITNILLNYQVLIVTTIRKYVNRNTSTNCVFLTQ